MKYSVISDIKFVCKSLNISNDEFAKEADISHETLSRLINEQIEPSNELLEKIYSLINIKIPSYNEFKIKALKKNHELLFFHDARDEIVGDISLSHSREFVDLGVGFYLGDNYRQSLDFVCQTKVGSIYVFDANFNKLKILKLEVSLDWMLLIALNRGKLEEYSSTSEYKRIQKLSSSYDVIIAPIADNRMFTTIDEFISSMITTEQAMHALKELSLGKQIVFKSEESLKHLKLLQRLFVAKEEKLAAKESKIKRIISSESFINDAYKNNIRKGLYISEVFKNEKDGQ